MSEFRTVAMDLRGHGDSDWDPETRYDTETLIADLAKIIAVLGFDRIILVGHSLGAAIAIRFAAENAARMAGLVIVDFGPELDEIGVNEVLRRFVDMPRTFPSAEEYTRWLIAHRPLADPNQLRQFARCSLRQSPEQGWELKTDAALATRSQMCNIKCPSLVIRGMASGILPHDVAARMAAQTLSAGRLATIGGAGHAVMMDNPGEFSSSVVNFLSGIAA
jgi:pimeloyl-ACP methyl ester carboxylesterase